MKKYSALFLITIIFCVSLFGCSSQKSVSPASVSVSLADEPYVSEKNVDINSNNDSIEITFDVPEAGYIKMNAFDSSDYEVWPEEIVRFFVEFKDESGNTLYEKIDVTDGMLDKCRFEAGKVIAEMTFGNRPKDMSCISLAWAYAPDKDEKVEIELDKTVTSCVNENGEAVFTFNPEHSGLYSFAPSEACVFEWDCYFRIETAEGKDIAGELMIHGTEWGSRTAFLPKGEYVITVTDVSAIASFRTEMISNCDEAVLEDQEGLTVPVQFGFTLFNSSERSAKLNVDGTKNTLVIVAAGTDTYYDSTHTVNVTITDAEGNVIFEELCEEIHQIDISEYSGEYDIKITGNGNCIVELLLINN